MFNLIKMPMAIIRFRPTMYVCRLAGCRETNTVVPDPLAAVQTERTQR